MAAADFEVGDLVWAKMKGYPFWPARIENSPSNKKRKAHHYVFFFGSENFAWISDENIVHHSEEMLKAPVKKKSTSYKLAIDQIISESEKDPIKSRPPVKKKGESEMVAESLPSTSSGVSKSKYDTGKVRSRTSSKSSDPDIEICEIPSRKAAEIPTETLSSSSSDPDIFIRDGIKNIFGQFAATSIKYTKKKVGFLGLGDVGQMIVKKLIESDHDVTVWNRTINKCEKLVAMGASYRRTASSVIQDCDVTFCCVSGPKAVKAIFSGPCGVLAGFENTTGKGYVELSTIDPATSIKNEEKIKNKGGAYLESPVSKSIKPDAFGSLVAICAGDFDLFTKCESCFHAFTRDVLFLSFNVGNAANLHLITNMFMEVENAATAESLALINNLNLNEGSFLGFFKDISMNNSLIHHRSKGKNLEEFFTGHTFKNRQKDLRLALTLSDSCMQFVPLAAATNQLYKQPLDLLHEPKNGESTDEVK